MGKLTEKERQNALNEVRILASIQHPNIISYKESFFEDKTSTLCIVMEHADGGDLLQKINQYKNHRKKIDEGVAWSYLIQMIRGL
jgi:NIMA (never in mitosis gene a)-related kinase